MTAAIEDDGGTKTATDGALSNKIPTCDLLLVKGTLLSTFLLLTC